MRLNYYRFPENTPEEVLLENECEIILKSGGTVIADSIPDDILKSGGTVIADSIPDDKRPLVDYVDDTLKGLSVKHVKQLLKKYGGYGWTEHCDRDGCVFETTDITIKGNNSKFKYNRHL